MILNDERRVYLIERLALKDDLTWIKRDYDKLFSPDVCTGEDLIRFRASNRLVIEEYAKQELANCRKEPLAHPRVRLRYLKNALDYAMTPQPIKSVPVRSNGKEVEYEITYAPDHSAINNIIRTAQNEEFFVKKFFLDAKKLELTREEMGGMDESGFEVITVDTGIKLLGSD